MARLLQAGAGETGAAFASGKEDNRRFLQISSRTATVRWPAEHGV